ncbi:MAG: ABC transporter ATP-binding protein [Nitrososphaerota archaeon]|jgi:iron complex transport system ATP-binding protein|nr:ABC transporter ATP-binding protein [Nitrososphaerota archaeon]
MVTLNVNGIDCRYGSVKILANVSLEVTPGCFLGILGPNGSGKTTLLKSISRVLKPHGGSILIDKEDIYKLKPKYVAKTMAVVSQHNDVGFNFSAMDVVLMGRNPHLGNFQMENTKDIEIAKNAMKLTNTWKFADRPINELSGGEAQRVIIARALAQEPKILLLDEPMSHLDIINQIELLDLIKKLCQENSLSVIAVIHDLNMASRYCDKLLLLKAGIVSAIGTVEQVITTDNIQNVFGINSIVRKNPLTNSPYIIPLSPKKTSKEKEKNHSIHIICGAGTGTPLLKTLHDEGYNISAGVLNNADTDFETCEILKILSISDPPFSAITDKAHKANLTIIKNTNTVILTAVPFGIGNIKNIETAIEAAKNGTPTYIIEETPVETRDFTNEKIATKLIQQLKKHGAIPVKNQTELLSNLKNQTLKN